MGEIRFQLRRKKGDGTMARRKKETKGHLFQPTLVYVYIAPGYYSHVYIDLGHRLISRT